MKTLIIAITLVIALGLGALHFVPTAVRAADFRLLDNQLKELKTSAGLPFGTAIALVQDGKVVYQHYSGYADIAAQQAVTADTAFYIASATKPFEALSVLLVAKQRKLNLNTNLQAMFPQQKFVGFDATKVSLSQLLSHQSGLDNPALVWATAYTGLHHPKLLEQLAGQTAPDPESQLGQFSYSNVGYNLTSIWQDRVTGQAWQQALQQQIFTPLQMNHSTAYASVAKAGHWPLALPYSLAGAAPAEPLYLRKVDQTMHAAGGMLSTAPDLAKFLLAQMRPGSGLDWSVVQQSQQQQASTASSYGDFQRSGYAWGWYLGRYKQQQLLHHFGGFAGFNSHLSFMPERGLGLVILHNEDMLAKDLNDLIADYCYGLLLAEAGRAEQLRQGVASLQKKLAKLPQRRAMEQKKVASRQQLLTLPVDRYVGHYSHPLLGTIEVRNQTANQLSLHWGQLHTKATGFDRTDMVRVEWVPNSGRLVKFKLQDRQVKQLSFDDLIFTKVQHRTATK